MIFSAETWLIDTDYAIIDRIALTLLIFCAFMAIRMRDLLVSAVGLGIFSLIMALLYLLLDAPDVALTEAAVGAGVSTVLFLCTLTFTEREQKRTPLTRRLVALAVVLIVGGALASAAKDLPVSAAREAPIHAHVGAYYIAHTWSDIFIPNQVTAILGSYRGFDTLGETGVIFLAGIGIAALLMNVPQIRPTLPEPRQLPAGAPEAPPVENPKKKPRKSRKKAKRSKKS